MNDHAGSTVQVTVAEDENEAKDKQDDLGAVLRESYFPTYIYFRDFPDGQSLNTDLLKAIRSAQTEDSDGIERSNVKKLGGWHSQNTLHQHPDFQTLVQRIELTAAEISDNMDYDPAWRLKIDNMWAVINPPGSFNRAHFHPGCLWSGVYYVQAPENAGRITFNDPRHAHLMMNARIAPGKRRASDLWSEVFFQPIPGRILLFPSWLLHSVEPNMTDKTGTQAERIIISFNLYQSRIG